MSAPTAPPPYSATPQGYTTQQVVYAQPGSYIPAQGTTVVHVQPQHVHPVNQVIIVGGCPVCRNGVLRSEYGCCAIFMCIFFFPLGFICCLLMRRTVCTNCGHHIS